MKTFFSIEDIETVFRDAYERGHWDGKHSTSDAPAMNANESWIEYKQGNSTVFISKQSIPPSGRKPEDLVCPICSAKMISRTNRQSGDKFWGCSKYPNCKGTRNNEGLSREEQEAAKNKPKEFQHESGYEFRKIR